MEKLDPVEKVAARLVAEHPDTPRMLASMLHGDTRRRHRAVIGFFTFHNNRIPGLEMTVYAQAVLAEAVAQMAEADTLAVEGYRQPNAEQARLFAKEARATLEYGMPLNTVHGRDPSADLMPE